ncbi:MAG: DUF1963 domain-containing protein [Pseudomonadota bacterium]
MLVRLLGFVFLVGGLSLYIAMETGYLGAGPIFRFLGLAILGILILLGLLVFGLIASVFIFKSKNSPENSDPKYSSHRHTEDRGHAAKLSQQPLLVTLKARKPEFRSGAKNWIGGLPHLGGTPWPRDSEGAPMFFIAQFDLANIASQSTRNVLPTSGSLAFFVTSVPGILTGQVLYLPPASPGPTQPPNDLGPVGIMIGDETLSLGLAPEEVPSTLPHWPVEFVTINAEDPDDTQSIEAEIETKFGLSHQNQFTFDQLVSRRGDQGMRFGDAAQRFARSLLNAADASEKVNAEFRTFIQTVSDWAETVPPWEEMEQKDVEQLEAFFAVVDPIRARFDNGVRFWGFYRRPHAFRSLSDIYTVTLLGMARGPDHVFDMLPEDVQEIINVDYTGVQKFPRHQIFGAGWRIQEAADLNIGNYLLLQITENDPIVPLVYGGDIQFYISPSDLAAGRWETADAFAES